MKKLGDRGTRWAKWAANNLPAFSAGVLVLVAGISLSHLLGRGAPNWIWYIAGVLAGSLGTAFTWFAGAARRHPDDDA